jgi:hypothetical protein
MLLPRFDLVVVLTSHYSCICCSFVIWCTFVPVHFTHSNSFYSMWCTDVTVGLFIQSRVKQSKHQFGTSIIWTIPEDYFYDDVFRCQLAFCYTELWSIRRLHCAALNFECNSRFLMTNITIRSLFYTVNFRVSVENQSSSSFTPPFWKKRGEIWKSCESAEMCYPRSLNFFSQINLIFPFWGMYA